MIFWLRLATLVALCLPAADLAWRWYTGDLEPRPVTLATHATGDWAVVFLLVSLALTPLRAMFDWSPLMHHPATGRRRRGALCRGPSPDLRARPEMEPDRRRHGDRQALLSHHRLRGAAGAGGARHHLDQRLAEAAQAQLEAPALAGLPGRFWPSCTSSSNPRSRSARPPSPPVCSRG